MTKVRATTSVFIKEVEFNWKINDFALLWNASDDISSPQFNIGHRKCCLRIIGVQNNDLILTVDGVRQNKADYHILYMKVDLGKDKNPMCGFLSIDTEENKISGIFGNPPRQMLRKDTSFVFKILTSRIAMNSNNTYFCISRQATQVDIGVELYFPSPISNTISHEPEEAAAGVAELAADMRALLNRSAENADFSIECGGKVFPCHEAILRARSTVMNTMFQNKMAEASARSLVLGDVGPNTVAAVLEYMYTGGITAEVASIKELVYIADKYDMAGLLDLCFRKLPEIGDDMIVDFLFMADKHNLVEYKKQAMNRINMNKSKYIEMAEASARSLVLGDVGPNTVAAVLEYMYTGGITAEVDNMKELVYAADKYDMAGLLDLCFRKLPEIADDMIVDFLFMADKHNLVEYKKQVMMRIIMNKSKYIEDQEFMEKLKELPHLLLELFKL